MEQIGGYLKRFSGILNSKQQSKKVIMAEVQKVLGIEIKKENIETKQGIVFIKESPIIRNTIFYNKKQILGNLQKLGLKVTDIK